MLDKKYQKALKEVNDILENTEENLVNQIPKKMIDFIHSNMDNSYKINIKKDTPLNQQNLMQETEEVLSLLYRSYWATEEEKKLLAQKDKKEILEEEKRIEKEQEENNIEKIFERRKNNSNRDVLENQMIVVKEKTIFQRILDRIKRWKFV